MLNKCSALNCVLSRSAALVLENLFGNGAESELSKAQKKADFNQPVIRQETINYQENLRTQSAQNQQDL